MNSSDRMTIDQVAALAGAICATAEILGQTISATAAELMAEDLADYAAIDVKAALQACRRELTGKLNLAAILQRVQTADGRPEPNEAWAIALSASDEFDSVMMTKEVQMAMAVSAPVLSAGDKIGARMAFLSAYTRFVDTARREATPAIWSLSLGFDPARRAIAVEDALRLGRLSAPEANAHLARLSIAPVTQNGAAIAGLITGRAAMPTPEVRARLELVKSQIKEGAKKREERQVQEREQRTKAFEAHRSEQLEALAELERMKKAGANL